MAQLTVSTERPRPPVTLLVAAPRGFCAGVDRAIKIVELALKRFGAPVYVRHEIVHNRHVVESLKAKGAIFVEELDEIPETDAPVIFSAHGVPKSVPAAARARNMFYLDATCPLVSKVHAEARDHHRGGPRDPADRPCRPPRGGRHAGPAAGRGGDPDRERRGRPALRAARPRAASPTSRRPRSPSTTRPPSSPFSRRAFLPSSARARRTSAMPPPTGRRPSRRSRRAAMR